VDWSMKASDDIDLGHVEYSSLPSGLHTVDQDVVYFSKDDYPGVCVFRRRQTDVDGHRGFHLSSIGILLADSPRARPWRHVEALKNLADIFYQSQGSEGAESFDWDHAAAFFAARKIRSTLSHSDEWGGWNKELESSGSIPLNDPILHLPHLLDLLGPSFLTIYKHVLGRRRIMIYAAPPIEDAGIFCQVLADICLEDQLGNILSDSEGISGSSSNRPMRGIANLGTVTLHDIDRLQEQSQSQRGWVACTTDALFLEKQKYYDLLIDMTAPMSRRGARPVLYASNMQGSGTRLSNRRNVVRFTWSDVKMWMELDRVVQIASASTDKVQCCKFSSLPVQSGSTVPSWWDPAKVYEDACVFCAGWWMVPWRAGSNAIRLEGDDDLGSRAGNVTTQPLAATDSSSLRYRGSSSSAKRSSTISMWSWAKSVDSLTPTDDLADTDDDLSDQHNADVRATLALLHIFHRHTSFLLSQLSAFIPQDSTIPSTVVLTAKDILAFNLGPYSDVDGQFLRWLMEEYGGSVRLVVKRNWHDILAIALGLGT